MANYNVKRYSTASLPAAGLRNPRGFRDGARYLCRKGTPDKPFQWRCVSPAQPLLQAICDLESPRVAVDRVAGDAAFVARAHVATGITKAALEAQCLLGSYLETTPRVRPSAAGSGSSPAAGGSPARIRQGRIDP